MIKGESFSFEKINKNDTLIFSKTDIDVIIDNYWVNHGKLYEFKNENNNFREVIHGNNVKIINKEYDLKIFDKLTHVLIQTLIVNNKEISGEVCDFAIKNDNKLHVDMIIGFG